MDCFACGHPKDDHVDGECQHNGPEDHCQDSPDPDVVQCACDGYWPSRD